jgi:hypothetical protein
MCVCVPNCVCDLETSAVRRPGPEVGCGATVKRNVISKDTWIFSLHWLYPCFPARFPAVLHNATVGTVSEISEVTGCYHECA